ncbi:type I restriction enzyme HsdR N-terminal domain-containing protein [Flavobacteriaceae bacterium]|nr:type I restriction enzyme HsdR N-terminal domain-containing protein [Flavobacteriaceae bacterium]
MRQLNFKQYSFRFKNRENKPLIFDVVRKKFMVLTPEEWVRQNTIQYLVKELNIPLSLINVEKQIKLHGTIKRYDIVTFNPDGSIHLIVECKADSIKISQDTFDQIARYNLVLKSTFLMVTNGIDHYYCKMDLQNKRYSFLETLPEYQK